MASVLKVPSAEAEKIFQKPGTKIVITDLVKKTGISRSTLIRYRKNWFESAPFWAVCKIMKVTEMSDEDRLRLIRCYSGEGR